MPCVSTLVEFDEGEVIASTLAGDPARALPHDDLFSKPADGTGGKSTERWRYVADAEGWVPRDGRVRSSVELLAELAELSRTLRPDRPGMSRRILLQPGLRNHRDLAPLAPNALCTLRILTCRQPGARARVLLAAYKMATGDAPADNFHFGGIVAQVDVTTGRLAEALRRRNRVLVPVERHPDTGARIEGHQIPCWGEALTLAERGLDASSGLLQVGWDVAITDDGPVIIEGNPISNPDIAQAPSGVPMSATPLPAIIDAHIRRAIGV